MCQARFASVSSYFDELVAMGLDDKVAVLGVGKTAYHNAIGAITAGSVCPFSEDDSNSAHPTWAEWGAAQRDLFIIDKDGRKAFQRSITPGFERDVVHNIVLGLIAAHEDSIGDGGCKGDVVADGVVNVNDILELLSKFGAVRNVGPADITGDGVVNVNDLLQLLSNFGLTCEPAPATACGCSDGEANVCCMAVTPDCLGCSQCCTGDQFCAENVGFDGCGGDDEPLIAIGRPFEVQGAFVTSGLVFEPSDWSGEP